MSRWVKAVLAVVVAFLLGAGVFATSAVARIWNAPITLDGLNSSSRVDVAPDAFWFGQMNRDGLCRLLTGCESATGSGSNWIFRMRVPVPVVGMQLVDVNVRVTEQVLLEKMSLSLSYDSALGSLKGDVTVSLRSSGQATIVTVAVQDMSGTGFGATAIPQLQERLVPDLKAGLADLNRETTVAGTKVLLTLSKGRMARASVTVTGSSLTKEPPRATGQMRVVVGGKVVCTARVKSNKGQCRFRAPARGAKVRVIVTGSFDNGYPIWSSAMKRYGK